MGNPNPFLLNPICQKLVQRRPFLLNQKSNLAGTGVEVLQTEAGGIQMQETVTLSQSLPYLLAET